MLEKIITINGVHRKIYWLFNPIEIQAIINEIGILQNIPCINAQIQALNDLLVAWKITCPPTVKA